MIPRIHIICTRVSVSVSLLMAFYLVAPTGMISSKAEDLWLAPQTNSGCAPLSYSTPHETIQVKRFSMNCLSGSLSLIVFFSLNHLLKLSSPLLALSTKIVPISILDKPLLLEIFHKFWKFRIFLQKPKN